MGLMTQYDFDELIYSGPPTMALDLAHSAYAAALARIASLEAEPRWEVAPEDEYQTDPYIYEYTNGIMFRIRGPSLPPMLEAKEEK